MQKIITVAAAILGGLAVTLGAMSGHSLKATLELYQRTHTFEIALRYHFYHALALLAIGLYANALAAQGAPPNRLLHVAGGLMLAGVLAFSGSLYIVALTNRSLGMITPMGGLALIAGWAVAAVAMARLGS